MTDQERKDFIHYTELACNDVKIRQAQDMLKSIPAKDLNTPLKDALKSVELARQQNHKMLCTASDRVYGY